MQYMLWWWWYDFSYRVHRNVSQMLLLFFESEKILLTLQSLLTSVDDSRVSVCVLTGRMETHTVSMHCGGEYLKRACCGSGGCVSVHNHFLPDLTFLFRFYIKESKGSRRWLLFLEGEDELKDESQPDVGLWSLLRCSVCVCVWCRWVVLLQQTDLQQQIWDHEESDELHQVATEQKRYEPVAASVHDPRALCFTRSRSFSRHQRKGGKKKVSWMVRIHHGSVCVSSWSIKAKLPLNSFLIPTRDSVEIFNACMYSMAKVGKSYWLTYFNQNILIISTKTQIIIQTCAGRDPPIRPFSVFTGTGILSPDPEENPHWWNANMV